MDFPRYFIDVLLFFMLVPEPVISGTSRHNKQLNKNDFKSRLNPRKDIYLPDDLNSFACEPIQINYCKKLGYNYTRMPNTLNYERQNSVKMTLDSYQPLFETNCSKGFQSFLCAVYLPMCVEQDEKIMAITPCEGWCLSEMAKCSRYMESFGYRWPDDLKCSRFPAKNDNETMCMSGASEKKTELLTTVGPVSSTVSSFCRFVIMS